LPAFTHNNFTEDFLQPVISIVRRSPGNRRYYPKIVAWRVVAARIERNLKTPAVEGTHLEIGVVKFPQAFFEPARIVPSPPGNKL
jgi:hypothetical protein